MPNSSKGSMKNEAKVPKVTSGKRGLDNIQKRFARKTATSSTLTNPPGDRPLIPEGYYWATIVSMETDIHSRFGARLYTYFKIASGEHKGVELFLPLRVTIPDGGTTGLWKPFSVSRKQKFFTDFLHPLRLDVGDDGAFDPVALKGARVRIKVTTVTDDEDGKKRVEAERYSKVERVTGWSMRYLRNLGKKES